MEDECDSCLPNTVLFYSQRDHSKWPLTIDSSYP
jgi:hypothetical protein